ncbi:MAG: hypothetical protein ABI592_10130 [Acidobacteriota bacterium]
MAALAPPLVTAVRADTPWNSRARRIECVARLTRPLTPAEIRGMSRFPEFTVKGDSVRYSCRPEEAEECEKRLASLLLECATGGAGRRPLRPV